MQKNSTKQTTMAIVAIASAFALGSLIGAGVGLLTAPQSGNKTRQMIRDKSTELKDRAAGSIGDTRERAGQAVSNLVDKTRQTTARLRQKSQEALESVGQA